MAERGGGGTGSLEGVKPGALSALLQELAAAPEGTQAEHAGLLPGAIVGRFEIQRELGRGGFGVAYQARDRELGRLVALKVVRRGSSPLNEEQAYREAEAIARLSHPNLVTLHDVGRSEAGPYLVFELLRGSTLQERLAGPPLPLRDALHVAVEVARGLACAHAGGVVHRDLKPSNIFLTDRGEVKILDFGMAHAFGRKRTSGGTPAYMAPEQWQDDPEDERTDVFAMGVMLYQMLSGELPFEAGEGRWSAESRPAAKLEVQGAPGLAELVDRMLARSPRDRPRDGAALLGALAPIEEALRTGPAMGSPATRVIRRRATFGVLVAELKRRHVFAVMAGYGILALAVLQVAERIVRGTHLPDGVMVAVLASLGGGLPLAAVLSWRLAPARRGGERAPRAGVAASASIPWARVAALPAGVALISALAGASWSLWVRPGGRGLGPTGIPVAGPDGRVTIAVADFANETRDPDLDGLSGLLITSLEQSKRLRVLTRSRMIDHARTLGRPDTERIDESTAREIGKRAAAQALLLASIRRLGDTYAVELRALDPHRDEYLFTLREQAEGKNGILPLIDRLSQRARDALREPEAEVATAEVKVGTAITGSLEAYRHYVLSQRSMEDHDFERAVAEAKAALEVDPGMALAHAWLAFMAEFDVAGGERTEDHVRAAVAKAGELPAKERRFVEALAASTQGRPEAEDLFRRLATDYPQDKYAAFFAGREAATPAERRGWFERALAIDPAFVWPVYLLLASGEPALDWAQRAYQVRPDISTLFNLGLALGLSGRLDEALEVALRGQAMAQPARVEVDSLVAAALASKGRLGEAARVLEPWLSRDASEAKRHMAAVQLIQIQVLQGRRSAALENLAADRRIRVTPHYQGWDALYAGLGNDDEAARRTYLATGSPPPFVAPHVAEVGLPGLGQALARMLPEDDVYRKIWGSVAAWRAGRPAAAIPVLTKVLDETRRRETHWAYLLGLMLRDAERCSEAIGEFDRVAHLFPWAWFQRAPFGVRMPLSLLEGARCCESLGRIGEARQRLDRLLVMWSDADPDLPALSEARAMRARLGAPR